MSSRVRQGGDETAERGAFERLPDLYFARVRLRQRHVGAERVVEQISVLRDERDAAAQVVELVLAQIVAVERDGALGRIPEPQQQIGERCLAGARRTDNRNGPAGADVEVDTAQYRPLRARIAKCNIGDSDRAAVAAQQHRGSRSVGDQNRLVMHRPQSVS